MPFHCFSPKAQSASQDPLHRLKSFRSELARDHEALSDAELLLIPALARVGTPQVTRSDVLRSAEPFADRAILVDACVVFLGEWRLDRLAV